MGKTKETMLANAYKEKWKKQENKKDARKRLFCEITFFPARAC
jgi:hypothetical protein